MRTFDTSIVTALGGETLRPFMLLEMNIDATHYRYTDCDVPIVFGGNTYSPRGFKAQPVSYSMNNIVDSVKFSLDNIDDILTTAFVGGTPQRSGVRLSLSLLNSSYSVMISPIVLFEGLMDDWSLTEHTINITVSNLLTAWTSRTLSKHSASCRWKKFKGQECGYSGTESWCDRSYTRCAALSNQANFGGFRWLPSIVDKEVWWGRTQAYQPTYHWGKGWY